MKKYKPQVCPLCKQTYTAPSATSRHDPHLFICPDCGTREALRALNVPEDEIEKIVKKTHMATDEMLN